MPTEASIHIRNNIFLIGGPNQSHKVNFKELPVFLGKSSKKTFRVSLVNNFLRFF
jgi:hypothetical protein